MKNEYSVAIVRVEGRLFDKIWDKCWHPISQLILKCQELIAEERHQRRKTIIWEVILVAKSNRLVKFKFESQL